MTWILYLIVGLVVVCGLFVALCNFIDDGVEPTDWSDPNLIDHWGDK